MLRLNASLVVLIVLVVFVVSCKGPSNAPSDQRTYRLKAGDMVPPELARAIEGKEYREGRNEVISFPTGTFYVVIANGQLESLILEEKGQQPIVAPIARMTEPPRNPPDEIPRNCDQKYDDCIGRCATAPDPQCCKCRCFVEWYLCRNRSGSSLSGGISLI